MYACFSCNLPPALLAEWRDFLRATVVTRGWNGYRNKIKHRKSTLEKKILPPFQQGFEPATFQSRVRRSNHWAIPAPNGLFGAHTVLYSPELFPPLHDKKERCLLYEAFGSILLLDPCNVCVMVHVCCVGWLWQKSLLWKVFWVAVKARLGNTVPCTLTPSECINWWLTCFQGRCAVGKVRAAFCKCGSFPVWLVWHLCNKNSLCF